MSFEYLALKRTKSRMILGLTEKAYVDFPVSSLVLWLLETRAQYRNSSVPAAFSAEAELLIESHERETLLSLDDLSSAGMLLMRAVLLACESPARGDLDENLALIHVAHTQAKIISEALVPKLKIGFTTRKHRDSATTRLMTVKGDPVGLMGLEAAILSLATLRRALERDMSVSIVLVNKEEIFGEHAWGYRRAPDYSDIKIWLSEVLLNDYLTKELSLVEAKESFGAIKVLSDHFAKLQIPANVG